MRTNPLENRLFATPEPKVTVSGVRLRQPKKFDEALLELPQIIDWLALASANGMSIYESIYRITRITDSKTTRIFDGLLREIDLGLSFEQALQNARDNSSSQSVKEFCNRLILTMQRGTPVATQLRMMAETNRANLRNQLLAKAGANEIKLLLPLVFMILPVTVWFAVFPSLQLLQLGL